MLHVALLPITCQHYLNKKLFYTRKSFMFKFYFFFRVQALSKDKFLKQNPHDEINTESITEEIVQKNKLRIYYVEYIQFGFIESVSNANRPVFALS